MTERLKEKLLKTASRYPSKESSLLPILHLIQEEKNYITDGDIAFVSELLSIPKAKVEGVISFYSMFFRETVGKWIISICRNISCSLSNKEEIVEAVKKELGIEPGETTPDGIFTLLEVECLGSCGTAPVMTINGRYYESLTPAKAVEIIRELKMREKKGIGDG